MPPTMGFLDLPSEIIDIIIDLSLPSGIEGLALTCKALHGRAKSQIERHNALKHRWKCTAVQSTQTPDNIVSLLYQLSLEPLGAHYVEILNLWYQQVDEDYYLDTARSCKRFSKDPEALSNLKHMVSRATYSSISPVDLNAWWEGSMTADGVFTSGWRATLMLLALLPNLRHLRLLEDWKEVGGVDLPQNGIEECSSRLADMISAANSHGIGDAPLSKLKAILPSMVPGYEERAGLQSWEPFMALKSLTEMYLVSVIAVDDGYTGIPFKWTSPDLVSSLNRMELVASCIDADGLSNLVSHTPKLSIFKYSHETKWHGCQHDWNPGTFIEALARHCGNSIREVALTIDCLYGEIENGASSFLALPYIHKLEVDLQVFCGPPVESGQRLGDDPHLPQGDRPWSREDIPCIGSMVPIGVIEVQINTTDSVADPTALKALLKNLRDQRKERLHVLERVIIREYGGDSAQEIADWSGATLESFDLGVEDMRDPSEMPEWKRNFTDRVIELSRDTRSL